jgi:hypothetical protein
MIVVYGVVESIVIVLRGGCLGEGSVRVFFHVRCIFFFPVRVIFVFCFFDFFLGKDFLDYRIVMVIMLGVMLGRERRGRGTKRGESSFLEGGGGFWGGGG